MNTYSAPTMARYETVPTLCVKANMGIGKTVQLVEYIKTLNDNIINMAQGNLDYTPRFQWDRDYVYYLNDTLMDKLRCRADFTDIKNWSRNYFIYIEYKFRTKLVKILILTDRLPLWIEIKDGDYTEVIRTADSKIETILTMLTKKLAL